MKLTPLILVFAAIAFADEPGPQPADIDKDNFSVTLSDGLTLQVIGVCNHPSDGQQWWKPDGAPLDSPPYDKFPGGAIHEESAEIRELAYQIVNQSKTGDDVSMEIKPQGTASSSSSAGNGNVTADAIAFPKDTRSISITWTIASGKWETKATATGQGLSSTGGSGGSVIFLPPHAHEKGTCIGVAHDYGKIAARVIAVSQDDQEHAPTGWTGSGIKGVTVTEFRFDLPPDQIKEYRLQTRPWDTVVEVSNISLNAGENPGAKIEVHAPKK